MGKVFFSVSCCILYIYHFCVINENLCLNFSRRRMFVLSQTGVLVGFVCLSVCPSVCQVCPSVCLFIYLGTVSLMVSAMVLSVLSVCLSAGESVCLFIYDDTCSYIIVKRAVCLCVFVCRIILLMRRGSGCRARLKIHKIHFL